MGAEPHKGATFDFDPYSEHSVKQLFIEHIKPNFDDDSEDLERLRISLAYYLQKDPARLEEVLFQLQDLNLPPFDDTTPFFIWLWEVLFPGQDYRAIDMSNVREEDDEDDVIHVTTDLDENPYQAPQTLRTQEEQSHQEAQTPPTHDTQRSGLLRTNWALPLAIVACAILAAFIPAFEPRSIGRIAIIIAIILLVLGAVLHRLPE